MWGKHDHEQQVCYTMYHDRLLSNSDTQKSHPNLLWHLSFTGITGGVTGLAVLWWLIATHCLYLQHLLSICSPTVCTPPSPPPPPLPTPILKACNLRRQWQPDSALIYWLSSATALLSRSPELHVVAVCWCGRTITGFRITLGQQNASAPDYM